MVKSYETLKNELKKTKEYGAFYTPECISNLLYKLHSSALGCTVYDPTCGDGMLLKPFINDCELYGQDISDYAKSMCDFNINFEIGDTLRNPKHESMLFSNIVSNPPYTLKNWGLDELKDDTRFKYGLPSKGNGDYAFIQHIISKLSNSGLATVVMAHGILFRGNSEGKIRANIIKDNLVDCVIGLPEKLFEGTSIPTCILVLKKNKKDNNILFINASKDYKKEKNKNILRDEDIEKIFDVYLHRKEIEKYSHIATFEEVEKNGFNLNIPRYVDSFDEEELVDIDTVFKNLTSNIEKSKELDDKLNGFFKELGLKSFKL